MGPRTAPLVLGAPLPTPGVQEAGSVQVQQRLWVPAASSAQERLQTDAVVMRVQTNPVVAGTQPHAVVLGLYECLVLWVHRRWQKP